ncbi:2-oxoacid:acceptor oxidoreductase subunit alpha, partial [Candidatus Bipolaricaulota bacterium]|nr:2-oxoacid:acceptor oxidoreductase subunit alpha [Candidatus Bipolaricaulota bacterium]
LPKRGGVFIQAEDEIAAIFMLIGASWADAKPMTATSGPGFSLMQEGLGIAVMTETPLLVVDVMRAGPGTGQASKAAQGDLLQARFGRHGDQIIPVFAPSSVQECFELTVFAVNVAEKLRTPVVLLSDELLAHTWEEVGVPKEVEQAERRRPSGREPPFGSDDPRIPPPMPRLGEGFGILMTGSTHDPWGFRRTSDAETHRALVTRLWEKIWLNRDWLCRYQSVGLEKAEVGVVAFGSAARSALRARELLSGRVEVGVLVLQTLWPIPEEPIRELAERVRFILVPELSLGQLIFDVERIVAGHTKVLGFSKVGGGVPIYPEELAR